MAFFTKAQEMLRAKRLGELLSPIAFDDADQFFICEDSCLAFGFEMDPVFGTDASVLNRLSALLEDSDFRDGSTLQFVLFPSPNIIPSLRRMKQLRMKATGALRDAIEFRFKFFESGAWDGIPQLNGGVLRDVKLFAIVKIPFKSEPSHSDLEKLCGFRSRLQTSLSDILANVRALDAKRWVGLMREMLFRDAEAGWRDELPSIVTHEEPLNSQVTDFACDLERFSKGFRVGDTHIRMLSCNQYPGELVSNLNMFYLSDIFQGKQGMFMPCFLTLNLRFPSNSGTAGVLTAKRNWTRRVADGPLGKIATSVVERARDLDLMTTELDQGARAVQVWLQIGVYGSSAADADHNAQRAKDFFSDNGFRVERDNYIHLPAFLNALPLGQDPRAVRDFQRYKTVTTKQACRLIPTSSDWKGSGTPSMQFVSRAGQLMDVCLFNSNNDFNGCISAQSGSGKSFLANYMVESYASQGAQIFIIDIGGSFKKLCDFLGGDYIDFDPDRPLCLNPFPLVGDIKNDQKVLSSLVATMAGRSEPTDLQYAKISEAVTTCYHERGGDMTVDDIAERLKADQDFAEVRAIGQQLYQFTQKGAYGSYFKGQNTVSFDNQITVLELERLRQMADLKEVVLVQLLFVIQQTLYLGDRDQRKLIILDEAWDLLSNPSTAKFMEDTYRRARKYNGSIVSITQSVRDYQTNPVGRAMMSNSNSMFMLSQKAADLQDAAGALNLDPGYMRLAASTRTQKPHFSEVFISSGEQRGVGRLIVPTLSRLLYSTDPRDLSDIEQARRELRDQSGVDDIGKALRIVAERRDAEDARRRASIARPVAKAAVAA